MISTANPIPTVDWQTLRAPGSEALAAIRIAPGITQLSESALAPNERSNFFLLEGAGCDLLIDGGWGLAADLSGVRDGGRPLIALATHAHCDHVGTLHLATERIGHALEADIFANADPWLTQARPWIDGRAMTAGGMAIASGTFRQEPCPLTRTVPDGQTLEIGGWSVTAMHVPGHSPGSLAFLLEPGGWLFCGDVVHDGLILDGIPGADASLLALSHQRLLQVDFSRALPGHGAILGRDAFAAAVARHWRTA